MNADEAREVVVYKHQKHEAEDYWEKVIDGTGIFHQFGCNYEEFNDWPGNYTTAIVEMPDGTVRNVPVDMIVFKK